MLKVIISEIHVYVKRICLQQDNKTYNSFVRFM